MPENYGKLGRGKITCGDEVEVIAKPCMDGTGLGLMGIIGGAIAQKLLSCWSSFTAGEFGSGGTCNGMQRKLLLSVGGKWLHDASSSGNSRFSWGLHYCEDERLAGTDEQYLSLTISHFIFSVFPVSYFAVPTLSLRLMFSDASVITIPCSTGCRVRLQSKSTI